MKKMIRTDKLVFEYIRRDEEGNVEGITRAVDDVNLSVEPGQFIAILGHNGSGKSTLLRCATNLEKVDNGEILYDGRKLSKDTSCFGLLQRARHGTMKPRSMLFTVSTKERK